MKRSIALLTVLFSMIVSPVFAMSLDEAKSKGLVGERLDGYVGAVQNNADAQSVVSTVNELRKQEYKKIAAKNGQPVSVVEKLAAKKLIERLGAGQFYMDDGGSWVKK